jgi:dihydroorotase-like cyclic amidohydrolase
LGVAGAIDAHVHFNDPLSHAEDFCARLPAAITGGVTT